MIKQREINQIEKNKTSDVIRILDKAIIKSKPAIPNKKLAFVISILLGIVTSFALLIALYFSSNRFEKYNLKIINYLGN